jgi:hypothetical protein
MRGITKALIAAAAAVALAAVPAAGNPIPEPEPTATATAVWVPVVAVGGVVAGVATYFLYKRHVASRPSFAGEDVTITLAPDRAYVTGVYRFRNAGDKPQPLKLRYPFARGPEVGEPENISVRDAEGGDVPFSWKRHDVAFEVTVPPGGEAAVTVSFEQACRGCEYTYILTSTRNWGRPIDEARFAVVAPVQLAPVECPYEWEETPAAASLVRYEFSRDDFYPDVDLTLRWQRPDFYFGSTALEEHAEAPAPPP